MPNGQPAKKKMNRDAETPDIDAIDEYSAEPSSASKPSAKNAKGKAVAAKKTQAKKSAAKKPAIKKSASKNQNEEQDDDEESDDREDAPAPIVKEFKDSVIAWVKLDDRKRTLTKESQIINKAKKKYEKLILDYMLSYRQDMIKISNGQLKRQTKTSKAPLKEEHVVAALRKKLKDISKAKQWAEFIYESRPDVEKVNLKRLVDKGQKGLPGPAKAKNAKVAGGK